MSWGTSERRCSLAGLSGEMLGRRITSDDLKSRAEKAADPDNEPFFDSGDICEICEFPFNHPLKINKPKMKCKRCTKTVHIPCYLKNGCTCTWVWYWYTWRYKYKKYSLLTLFPSVLCTVQIYAPYTLLTYSTALSITELSCCNTKIR